jgi:hypothetical protein
VPETAAGAQQEAEGEIAGAARDHGIAPAPGPQAREEGCHLVVLRLEVSGSVVGVSVVLEGGPARLAEPPGLLPAGDRDLHGRLAAGGARPEKVDQEIARRADAGRRWCRRRQLAEPRETPLGRLGRGIAAVEPLVHRQADGRRVLAVDRHRAATLPEGLGESPLRPPDPHRLPVGLGPSAAHRRHRRDGLQILPLDLQVEDATEVEVAPPAVVGAVATGVADITAVESSGGIHIGGEWHRRR